MKKTVFLLTFLLIILLNFFSRAFPLDTDLYVVSNVEVPPNILILFDNSGSMNEKIPGVEYDKTYTYPFVVTEYPEKVYYYKSSTKTWALYRDSIDLITCESVRIALQNEHFYNGKIIFSSSACGGSKIYLATGNYVNYLQATGGPGDRPKLGLAKGIIQSYINTTEGVRFGAMIFNYSEGGRLLREIRDMTPQNRADLHSAIGGLQADTWTPLAETLYEAGLYFKGAKSYFNSGVTYTSPLQYYCQKNYVIIITDGESTMDKNPILASAIGDRDGDGREPGGSNEVYYEYEGSDYLDDVAKYLYENDFSSDLKGKQNIITYTIGFTVSSPLLERTAKYGGGKYFYCHNAQSFIIAFQKIIDEILAKSVSYVAPVVPISQMENTSSGNRMYLAMFKPSKKSFWKGNIKKFGISTENSGEIKIGDILDATGQPAMVYEETITKIKDTSKSYWSSEPDGEDVERGGVGEVLLKRASARNIYTYLGTSVNLNDSSNAFILSNTGITPAILGLSNNDFSGRDKVINFIHGLDAYDEDGNGITDEKRDWILGAFIHSRPFIIHYGNQSVIYAGANDGMLHAFDDATGEELWAFIPPNLLPKLKNLNGETIEFFVDGSPKAYIEKDNSGNLNKAILIFGQRRGGDRYIALDITNPVAPKWLWEINPSIKGYNELGQTWSTPQIVNIKYGPGVKGVAIVGGGYDENQDNLPVTANDSKGRAIYVIDVLTGNLIWSYSYVKNSSMKYCIPSDIARVDTDGNGQIDRIYVGDMGGRIWRFDIGDSNTNNWTARIVFDSNPGSSDKRKIFYPPDVTLEKGNYEMIFFGTGDREHPKESVVINRLYAIKDKNQSYVLTENDLVDVTSDLLQNPNTTSAQRTSILNELEMKNGWYIKLDENPGEKSLASSVVFYGVVYYTTFTPTFGSGTDICFVGEGTSRLYALKYQTGNAVFNFDLTNDVGGIVIKREDRSKIIGTAIPSGLIITFTKGVAAAYVGVGEGVFKAPVQSSKSIVPINWRIVF